MESPLQSFNQFVFSKIAKETVTSYMLNYVAKEYEAIIACPPTALQQMIPFRLFIEKVVRKSKVDTGTLLTSLNYAKRLKSKLYQTSKGMECTHHRIFLATLIITYKYIHDSSLKNKHWANYVQIFGPLEINLMEKQLLQLLEYSLEISTQEFEKMIENVVHVYFEYEQNQKQINSPPLAASKQPAVMDFFDPLYNMEYKNSSLLQPVPTHQPSPPITPPIIYSCDNVISLK